MDLSNILTETKLFFYSDFQICIFGKLNILTHILLISLLFENSLQLENWNDDVIFLGLNLPNHVECTETKGLSKIWFVMLLVLFWTCWSCLCYMHCTCYSVFWQLGGLIIRSLNIYLYSILWHFSIRKTFLAWIYLP